jgi:hypothetical protein
MRSIPSPAILVIACGLLGTLARYLAYKAHNLEDDSRYEPVFWRRRHGYILAAGFIVVLLVAPTEPSRAVARAVTVLLPLLVGIVTLGLTSRERHEEQLSGEATFWFAVDDIAGSGVLGCLAWLILLR